MEYYRRIFAEETYFFFGNSVGYNTNKRINHTNGRIQENIQHVCPIQHSDKQIVIGKFCVKNKLDIYVTANWISGWKRFACHQNLLNELSLWAKRIWIPFSLLSKENVRAKTKRQKSRDTTEQTLAQNRSSRKHFRARFAQKRLWLALARSLNRLFDRNMCINIL